MQTQALIYRRFGPPLDALALEPLALPPGGGFRVAMVLSPVNPSDLIPVTGAYAHRITLPCVAGYEGVGRVLDGTGRRVLPLRAGGTWQKVVAADPDWAVPVPEDIPDTLAARAYINPMAARGMLARWPVAGRRVLLSGAGSHCAALLGRWALAGGATEVAGIYRAPARRAALEAAGIRPIPMADHRQIAEAAARADVAFDSLGGPVGTLVLERMRAGADFVGYGLLSGQTIRPERLPGAGFHRFHLREAQAALTPAEWQAAFAALWPLLREAPEPPAREYPLTDWRAAIAASSQPGGAKVLLRFPEEDAT
ncbi:alcohol dehydrogenase [Pararhodobacter sp.]|uniref:alcohol dehydrogenase n=1 Tax=Pararhodobacter sp. TaxID=2127056 RepID=UPI002FE0801E